MARLFTNGFEVGGSLDPNCGDVNGSGSVTATYPRTGAYSLECTSAQGSGMYFAGVTGRTYYTRVYVRQTVLPSSASDVLIVNCSGGNRMSVRETTGGALQLHAPLGTQRGSDSSGAIAADGTWHKIELSCNIGVGATDSAELRLNGVTVASFSGLSITDDTVAGFLYDSPTGATTYFDDIAINDDQGASQNSWCGDGNIVLLVPTSDSARAAKWTGGAGGTTNLYNAVNNTPPIGTATETDLTQIEHAGGAAGTTDAYDANMTTYTSAGVPAGATVTVVQPVLEHGEDINTGTKNLSFEVVSNPVVSSSGSFNAGGNAGALGTWAANPSTWKRTWGSVTYNPSVTLGTSPVMRVIRPETATRVASVCFMGMYVEYQSAQQSPPPYQRLWRRTTKTRWR